MTNLIILTGVFGAGRTIAMKSFEEDGYFTSDNIPYEVAQAFFDCCLKEPMKYQKVAISVANIEALKIYKLAKAIKEFNVTFVGVSASNEVLRDRYTLENKMHPLQTLGLSLDEAISEDKKNVRKLTDYYDVFIDTSLLNRNEFKNILYLNCLNKKNKFRVNFFSFGYKRDIPQDIETVFDVRLIRNPHWEVELKDLDGTNQEVIDYVMGDPNTPKMLKKIQAYLDYYLEALKNEGRQHANIGIACSAGKQRSVVIANYLAKVYGEKYSVHVRHRDLEIVD